MTLHHDMDSDFDQKSVAIHKLVIPLIPYWGNSIHYMVGQFHSCTC